MFTLHSASAIHRSRLAVPAEREPPMRRYASFLHGRVATVAAVCALVVLGCAAVELGYRIHSQRPVFALPSWRAWRIEFLTFGARGKFDPLLGWVSREWHQEGGYN